MVQRMLICNNATKNITNENIVISTQFCCGIYNSKFVKALQHIVEKHSDFWSANTQLLVTVSIQSCLSVILSLYQLLKPDYEKRLLCF